MCLLWFGCYFNISFYFIFVNGSRNLSNVLTPISSYVLTAVKKKKQSRAKPKLIVFCLTRVFPTCCIFSRPWRRLHRLSLSSDWFTVLVCLLWLVKCDCFGFAVTTVIRNRCKSFLTNHATQVSSQWRWHPNTDNGRCRPSTFWTVSDAVGNYRRPSVFLVEQGY